MADATLVLKVDLDCCLCYKKIRKTLCRLQDRENIRSIVYDEKKNNVLVSGPFDPKRLSRKLCCMACKVIKDIHIQEPKPAKTEQKESKQIDSPPPPGKKRKEEEEAKTEPSAYPYPVPVLPVWPAFTVPAGACRCSTRPWCCCSCGGRDYVPPSPPAPAPAPRLVQVYYGGAACPGTCQFSLSDNYDNISTCSIM